MRKKKEALLVYVLAMPLVVLGYVSQDTIFWENEVRFGTVSYLPYLIIKVALATFATIWTILLVAAWMQRPTKKSMILKKFMPVKTGSNERDRFKPVPKYPESEIRDLLK